MDKRKHEYDTMQHLMKMKCHLLLAQCSKCRRLNALDIKLYEHAKQLVQKRRQALEAAGKLQTLPALAVPAAATDAAVKTGMPDCTVPWWLYTRA
jgi:recombinational DNA repair ATPase RecF